MGGFFGGASGWGSRNDDEEDDPYPYRSEEWHHYNAGRRDEFPEHPALNGWADIDEEVAVKAHERKAKKRWWQ